MATVTKLLEKDWRDINEIHETGCSFHCLIRFSEYGLNGEENRHISTGVYYHIRNEIHISDSEMKKMTPAEFIPLYINV